MRAYPVMCIERGRTIESVGGPECARVAKEPASHRTLRIVGRGLRIDLLVKSKTIGVQSQKHGIATYTS